MNNQDQSGYSMEELTQTLKNVTAMHEAVNQPMKNAGTEKTPEQPRTQTIEITNIQQALDYLKQTNDTERFQVWRDLQDHFEFESKDISSEEVLQKVGLVSLGCVAFFSAAKWLSPGLLVFTVPVKGLIAVVLLLLVIPSVLFRNNPKRIQFLLFCNLGFLIAVILAQ